MGCPPHWRMLNLSMPCVWGKTRPTRLPWARFASWKPLVCQTPPVRSEPEQLLHRKVLRPWGWHDEIDYGPCFKVKPICVKPEANLSLQNTTTAPNTGWSSKARRKPCAVPKPCSSPKTYIPFGKVHRLANPGTIPLEMIEVLFGSYLGEDDIVRLEHRYGRRI